MAHRLLLTYLVKAVATALPDEAVASTRDSTATSLRNSAPQFFDAFPADARDRLTALTHQEIDRILIAPSCDLRPGEGSDRL
jgi:hypothetical protein